MVIVDRELRSGSCNFLFEGMRLKTKLLLGCIAACVLSSCATTTDWVHQSKDGAAFNQDDTDCLAYSPGDNSPKEDGSVVSEAYNDGNSAGRALRRKVLGEKI